MPRGGKREGAGRRAGSKNAATLDKEQAREALRAIVKEHMAEMVAAQVDNAKGLKYLIARDKKSGKFRRLSGDDAALTGDSDSETIEVWAKDPNVSAFTDLLNRTLDKPTEHVEMEANITGSLVLERLTAGRKRVANAKR